MNSEFEFSIVFGWTLQEKIRTYCTLIVPPFLE